MSEKGIKRLHLIYGIVLSALLVTVAVLFIVMCIDIYSTTGAIGAFTRDKISERFAKIAVVVYITVAAIIGGVILNIVLPTEKKRLKGDVHDGIILERLSSKLTRASVEARDKIEKQRIIRFVMIIISLVLVIAASITAFVFVLTSFDATNESINREVGMGWLSVTWYFIVPVAYLIATAYICKRSMKKELEIVKNELKNQKNMEDVCENEESVGTFTKVTNELSQTVKRMSEPKKWHKYFSIGFKIALACLIVVFIIVGVINGGMNDVAVKANKICSECIGLG